MVFASKPFIHSFIILAIWRMYQSSWTSWTFIIIIYWKFHQIFPKLPSICHHHQQTKFVNTWYLRTNLSISIFLSIFASKMNCVKIKNKILNRQIDKIFDWFDDNDDNDNGQFRSDPDQTDLIYFFIHCRINLYIINIFVINGAFPFFQLTYFKSNQIKTRWINKSKRQ